MVLKGHFFYLIFTSEIADNVIRTLASAIKSAGGTVSHLLVSCWSPSLLPSVCPSGSQPTAGGGPSR
jgi:hypothetical protein